MTPGIALLTTFHCHLPELNVAVLKTFLYAW